MSGMCWFRQTSKGKNKGKLVVVEEATPKSAMDWLVMIASSGKE
jgi:hypothetical protein